MVKRKDSASGVSIEDPTDKSEQNTDSYFFQPTRHDLLPIVLALVVIALGLTAGLLSYFLLQNTEQMNARTDLQVRLQNVKTQLKSATDSVTNVVLNTASFFQVSKTPITLYDQFVPYIMSGGEYPKYLTVISYVDYVPVNNSDTYAQQLRNSGNRDYANFTITSRDANYRPIAPLYTPVRCVIVQTVPITFMSSLLGFVTHFPF
jgi:CHASE1-domain containing sensor protein